MDTPTSTNSCGTSSIQDFLVADHRDFKCRCCAGHFDEAQPLYEFRNGDWMCKRCFTLILAMDQAGEGVSYSAFSYMSQSVIISRWER